jgi:hypothetical protein
MRQPIRSNADSACLALVEGQSGDSFLGGNEGHVHWAGDRFPMLQTVGE